MEHAVVLLGKSHVFPHNLDFFTLYNMFLYIQRTCFELVILRQCEITLKYKNAALVWRDTDRNTSKEAKT